MCTVLTDRNGQSHPPKGTTKMVKRRSVRTKSSNRRSGRGAITPTIANPALQRYQQLQQLEQQLGSPLQLPALRSLPKLPRPTKKPLHQNDGRTFHPSGKARPTPSLTKAARRLLPSTLGRLAYADPSKVLVCARREVRRQVLHATGIAGANRLRNFRKPRRTGTSGISC